MEDRMRVTSPSASSGDLLSFHRQLPGRIGLLEVFVLRATVIVAGPPLDLRRAQHPLRFDDGPFAMQPLRLNRVQPGALARQLTDHDTHPAFTLGPAVVFLDPAPYPCADVP